ncbi:hypothetical protein BUALT_Bualt15G0102200 [Buddleja alternifolia]|uniref:MULE transposase domain-containing protein n=1 Tax=Buddleja alternifolia TaxID=168488 RepID=A0AAV6WEN9_9LAMI|nr:hypothetical protein BUALT_Bualt15G0102200 [Buddleja alternifolia]
MHKCGKKYHVKNCNSVWLGRKYENAFRNDPNRNVNGFRQDVVEAIKGLKQGFLYGCGPIIGVDGCHLKGPHGGVMLTVIGINPNNNSYPIYYAVVGGETKDLWEWFLTLLKNDLNIQNDHEWTFMSDKQKGLIPAFETVFPNSENRFCVRHLFGNMKTAGFRKIAYKRALWKVAGQVQLQSLILR